jgi:hypothetical protein
MGDGSLHHGLDQCLKAAGLLGWSNILLHVQSILRYPDYIAPDGTMIGER